MGLTSWLHSLAARRPHVLLLPAPGADAARVAAERELRERGWVAATSPADADALLVLGVPGEELVRAADRVWAQLPGPRVRLAAATAAEVAGVLRTLPAHLADRATHLADAVGRGPEPAGSLPPEPEPEEDGPEDMGGMDHGGMDHGDMDMGMDLPGGLAMADRADDRDGLKLDVLHEQLGPALPAWPAGLVLDVVLQGDVAQQVSARVLPAVTAEESPLAGAPVADRLDRLARLLTVAGWGEPAVTAGRLRDAVLAGKPVDAEVDRLLARVRRSRTLRLLGRGLAVGTDRDLGAHLDLLCSAGPLPGRTAVEDLPALLTGLDLGALRLVLAAADPDTSAAVEAVPA